MSKLVDKERLARLAAALDARAKAAVKAEEERAMAAEQAIEGKADANAAAINAINHEETGILAQAKAHAQGLVDGEKDRAEEAEGALSDRLDTLEGIVGTDGEAGALGKVIANVAENTAAIAKLNGGAEEEGSVAKAVADAVEAEKDLREEKEAEFEGRIAANEAFVAAQPAVDTEQDRRLGVLEADAPVKQAAIEAAQQAADDAQADVDAVVEQLDGEGGLVDRIEAVEALGAKLDGDANVEGSVKAQVKAVVDAQALVNEDVQGRVEVLEGEMDAVEADVAQVKLDMAAGDAKALEDAQKYADEKIAALVDSAPDAMNTLNELAEAINANKDIYDAYIGEHATAMAAMKAELQAEIDADVKAVVDAQKLVNDAQAEVNEDFEDRIAANEGFVAAQPAIDAEQDRRLGVLEASVGEGGATKAAIEAAQAAADAAQKAADDAQAAADAAQGDVDTIESRLDAEGGLVDRIEANEAFVAAHSHEQIEKDIDAVEERCDALEGFVEAHDHSVMEQGIADNKAAIEKEVGDRDAAIAKALEVYSTTEEMKAILGNVVNSLNLAIVDNEVKLTLGSEEDGIAIATARLAMATDAEIDAIIAGLDNVEAE